MINLILPNLRNAVITSLVLTLVVFWVLTGGATGEGFWPFIWRLLHVVSGVMWVGLLWYFNFVQIPNMPKIPDEQKPAISKVIAPAALFWFRWSAMVTIITGLIVAMVSGYLIDALALGTVDGSGKVIGIGMWLGTIMWFNVWFVIWPNQKRALGIVEATPDVKAASARTAMLFSRTNMVLSIPMLFCMVAQQNLG
ncbi:MAG: urate hydroxylase PuuD [Rhodospirillaceae bacterium]|nr:urate hydroxylase PuuD [Rhodospirillaceae bacterium]